MAKKVEYKIYNDRKYADGTPVYVKLGNAKRTCGFLGLSEVEAAKALRNIEEEGFSIVSIQNENWILIEG